jgi:hypothetical protein
MLSHIQIIQSVALDVWKTSSRLKLSFYNGIVSAKLILVYISEQNKVKFRYDEIYLVVGCY